MQIDNMELRTALDYLRLFRSQVASESGDETTKRKDDIACVVFEPRGERLIAAVRGQTANGSYQLSPRMDITSPFAMSLDRTWALSRELSEEDIIEIQPGEQSHFLDFSTNLTRQINLAAYEVKRVSQTERPNVAPLQVSAGKLNRMISAVRHAAGPDRQGKWDFKSVLIEYRRDAFHVVASDAKRLAYRTTEVIAETPEEITRAEEDELVRHHQLLVPSQCIDMLLGALEPGTDTFLWPAKNQLWISSGPRHAVLPLVEGRYPDYRSMIEDDTWKSAAKITTDREVLLHAIKSCMALTEVDRGIDMYVADGQINLSIEGSVVECPCRISGNTELTYSVDGRFMRDALSAIENDDVKLLLTKTPGYPIAIRVENHLEVMAQLVTEVTSD